VCQVERVKAENKQNTIRRKYGKWTFFLKKEASYHASTEIEGTKGQKGNQKDKPF